MSRATMASIPQNIGANHVREPADRNEALVGLVAGCRKIIQGVGDRNAVETCEIRALVHMAALALAEIEMTRRKHAPTVDALLALAGGKPE